jgi:hypothetical protein
MYSIILLESTSTKQIEHEIATIKTRASKLEKVATALLIELSAIILFVLGIYAGIYGTKGYGYDYFVKTSKTFIGKLYRTIFNKDVKDARKNFDTVNAASLFILVFLAMLIWHFYKLSTQDTKVEGFTAKDFTKFEPYAKKAIVLSKTQSYNSDPVISMSIASLIVSHKLFGSELTLSEFVSKCVTKLTKGITAVALPLFAILALLVYAYKRKA